MIKNIVNYPKFSLLFFFIWNCSNLSWAQGEEPGLNIQNYTPSVLLQEEQIEFKNFNNLYTQTQFFQGTNRVDADERQTFLTSINQIMTGIAPRVNVGFEFWINSARFDQPESSALKLFSFENNARARTVLSYFGPKLKIAPIPNWDRFAIQSTFLFPIAEDLSGSEENPNLFVANDRYLWITQFFWDKPLGARFQLFNQIATWYTLNRFSDRPDFRKIDVPISVFLSYFPSERWTVFISQEFWSRFNRNNTFTYFYQPGIGIKFQVIPGQLELEGSYTNFILGQDEGAGNTFNIGVRLIR